MICYFSGATIKPGEPVIGFIGLGLMGAHMARRIHDAGFELVLYNRTASKASDLVGRGAKLAPDAATVASAADVVITMLTDGPDVRQVVAGPRGVLEAARAGTTWIDMSTISSEVTRELGLAAAARGVACLDAPVSGGPAGAQAGTLSIMVGGPADVYDACLPLLSVLGSTIAHMGGLGAGQITKACNQVMVAANLAGVAEALVLGAKAGVDPAKIRQVLLGGYAQSKILEVHGERMIRHRFEPGFFARLHDKDLHIVLDMARALGAAAPISALVSQMLNSVGARGDGELDNSAIVKVYEAAAAIEMKSEPQDS
jgi:2-hydroxy-3-oxopropionate reductase